MGNQNLISQNSIMKVAFICLLLIASAASLDITGWATSNSSKLASCVAGKAKGVVMADPMGLLKEALHGLGLRRQRRNWSIGGALSSAAGAVAGAASSAANAVASAATGAFNAAKAFGCGMGLNKKAGDVCKGMVGKAVGASEGLFGKHANLKAHWKDAVEPCLTETFNRFCDEMADAACARLLGKKDKKGKKDARIL